ncbi:MAG: galactokinase [Lachnospiraceae bacterium]|uniref:galactokinase n=1 Tax=Parablautia sp. Marseille-Q6255 TaxID=3039593 RepID=UPI0024BCAC25|nr:galactokinase family protein [Parablautia sp. Marseille-Q6255]
MKMPEKATLEKIYGESQESLKRYERLAERFKELYGSEEMEFFTSPGRTEIVGNHTDHNGGRILAASINMDTIGAAYPSGDDVITIVSEGYKNQVVIDLNELESVPKNKGTLSLVAGMVVAAKKWGFRVSGFRAYVSTQVISAAGVSSSASFEMLICSMINYFFNENKLRNIDYARMGQYAENYYWDKGSGLMDQMACASGGTILLDFSKNDDELCRHVDFSFAQIGYDLVIVNTGKGHADLSEEYSSVPNEMKEAAAAMGAKLLCEKDIKELLQTIPKIDNDRAILRALHFYKENQRVDKAYEAALTDDTKALLEAITESGRSSWEWLQNCYTTQDVKDQKISLALALTQLFLERTGKGVCRIHGGGFAGVIACVLPKEETADYVSYISEYFGRENVYPMNIRLFGAGHVA